MPLTALVPTKSHGYPAHYSEICHNELRPDRSSNIDGRNANTLTLSGTVCALCLLVLSDQTLHIHPVRSLVSSNTSPRHSAADTQEQALRGGHSGAGTQRQALSGRHSAADTQRQTLSGRHSATDTQRHTLSGRHSTVSWTLTTVNCKLQEL